MTSLSVLAKLLQDLLTTASLALSLVGGLFIFKRLAVLLNDSASLYLLHELLDC